MTLTNKLQKIEAQLADPGLYEDNRRDTIRELTQEQQKLKSEIEKKEEQWIALSED